MSATPEREYVLGTDDEEITRLGVQHRVWRPRALEAWRRAGFRSGHTIADLGSGPGYAAQDLAELVGPAGRVVAIERSRRFLDALEREATRRGVANIVTYERDLDTDPLPEVELDGAWCRFVAAFAKRPRAFVAAICKRLRSGGAIVFHEYLDYAAWRLLPPSPEFDEFVHAVIATWRASGGEPDIGLALPAWLETEGLRVEVRAIGDVVSPSDPIWQWPMSFFEVGLRRLVTIGAFTNERAETIAAAVGRHQASNNTRMLPPIVGEIIAHRS